MRVGGGLDIEHLPADGVRQLQAGSVQHQAQWAKVRGENAVLAVIAMGGVAEDGVVDVFHVAAQLVFAPLFRVKGGEAVARGGMTAVTGQRDFAAAQAVVVGFGILRGFVTAAVAVSDFVRQVGERVVNVAAIRQPAAHHGVIGFVQAVHGNVFAHAAGGGGVKRDEQHTAGRAVKAVHGVGFQAGLLLQQVGDGGFGVAVKRAGVDEDTCRFVDGDEVFVLVEDGEGHGVGGDGGDLRSGLYPAW